MKRELGIARCGLACCLCSENEHCSGCNSGGCPDKDWCENRKCSIKKNCDITMNASRNAEKDWCPKSSPMVLHYSLKDMGRQFC